MKLKHLTLSAMFLALGLVLPFVTMQVPQIGSMLLPMHLPVFLCGMVCGPWWGLLVGALCPLLRHLLFQMPPLVSALPMAFELAAYGLVSGFLFARFKEKDTKAVYLSLIPAMIVGRIVWGLVQVVLFSLRGNAFTIQAFLAGALTTAIPGIILQLILIPLLIKALKRYL